MNPYISIIIPAYNEAQNIEKTVKDVTENTDYDYIVINDCSKDNTKEVCEKNNFNMISLPINYGLTSGIQVGMKYAYKNDYDIAIQFDGDGQHDVSCIKLLVEQIEKGSDLAIGSRFLEPSTGFKSTFMRRLGIKWLCGSIRLASGLKVTDPTSGFRATGPKALEYFCKDYPADYPEPESIVAAKKAGLTISEVQVVMHERQGGVSSINPLSSVYYMIKVTLAVFLVGLGRKRK
mgnify:CR=1 FL=1